MGGDRGFALSAHFIDNRRSVEAIFDGYSWTVETVSGPVSVRDIDQAIRIARQSIGELLRRVDRRPGWGLRVEVADVAASYGEPDPEEVSFPSGGRADPNSLVARIRGRWRQGDSPESALDNALEIVRGYAGRSRRSAVA
ncbi:MAG TPA: hypothetical protein VGC63_09875 [Solirubrobacterales bacterium]|jgi:hypothetical protein